MGAHRKFWGDDGGTEGPKRGARGAKRRSADGLESGEGAAGLPSVGVWIFLKI